MGTDRGTMIKDKYPDSELTGRIIGLIYKAQNITGKGFAEKVYQKVFENLLNEEKIEYRQECYCELVVNEKNVGNYRLDFLIESRLIVEFKVRDIIYQKDISQILNYLAINKLKVGLLACFTNNGVKIKRLVY